MNNDTRSREDILKDTVAEGLRIQHQFRPEPLYKTTGRGSYQSNTVQEIAAAMKKPEADFEELDANRIITEAKSLRNRREG